MSIHETLKQINYEIAHYFDFGVEAYPNDPDITGHNIIPHPGLFFVSDFSPDCQMHNSNTSEVAAELSTISKEELVIVELVPENKVEAAIGSTARALREAVDDPDNTVFVPILNGGVEYYQKLRGLLPYLLRDDNFDSIEIRRTNEDKLIEPEFVKNFNPDLIRDKTVWLVEDLGDENITLRAAADEAMKNGAREVKIIMLANKLGTKDKLILPEIQIVGFGIPGDLWMGGIGADFMKNIGRKLAGVWIKFTPEQWMLRFFYANRWR